MKTLGLGSVSAIAAGLLPIETRAAIDRTESMKVTKIEGIRFSENINIGGGSGGANGAEFFWVRLHTDSGISRYR